MTVTDDSTLRDLENVRPLYMLPVHPFVNDVLIPAFKVADKVDCMVGFFSSKVLASLAPGLATFIASSDNSLRLLISPFLRLEDQEAIRDGIQPIEGVASRILNELIITEDSLQIHTLKCLSWLLRKRRIEIKIAVMKDALFHPKVWLFESEQEIVAAHGSSNVTHAGIYKNIEQIAISRSWQDQNQFDTARTLLTQFERFWKNQEEFCTVVELPEAVRRNILQNYDMKSPPTEAELLTLFRRANNDHADTEFDRVTRETIPEFEIPDGLQYEDGQYAHQGKAVKAWCQAGCNGVLEMATGSGKTITAMLCAYRLYENNNPLFIVVAAPYIPLIQQWCEEIEYFGLKSVNLTDVGGVRGRANSLGSIRRKLDSGRSKVEVVVVSHSTLCDSGFQSQLKKFESASFLIADEVHNLGSKGFTNEPPSFFDFRLGLSATPIRQYDEQGTQELHSFFGPVVFNFSLKEAIGNCLVEYEYYVHPVELTNDEMDRWYDLTAKIKSNAWRLEHDKNNEYLMKLFHERRLVLETAEEKITILKNLLNQYNRKQLRYTLIYASDKRPQQLEQVNQLLKLNGTLFHQLTYEETADREKTKRIIRLFQEGSLQILTAKRVLDEGVNIPQVQRAFFLASTTVERQWIQRRGRLLRTCQEIGKTHSEIHDFVVLPPELESNDDARNLVRSELRRIQEFAKLANNAGRSDGPLELIDQLVRTCFL